MRGALPVDGLCPTVPDTRPAPPSCNRPQTKAITARPKARTEDPWEPATIVLRERSELRRELPQTARRRHPIVLRRAAGAPSRECSRSDGAEQNHDGPRCRPIGVGEEQGRRIQFPRLADPIERLLLSRICHDLGSLDTTLPFTELKRRRQSPSGRTRRPPARTFATASGKACCGRRSTSGRSMSLHGVDSWAESGWLLNQSDKTAWQPARQINRGAVAPGAAC